MTEFIGSRISLISKRDIRYVGILHEISSENSTVALERVVSYGTEGRRPDDEVPPSLDNVYEYIVFRGGDVKDLRIEEGPKENTAPKPCIPDDPAILGSTRKPTPGQSQQQAAQPPPQQPQQTAGAGTIDQGPHQQQHMPGGFPPQNIPYGFNPNQRFNGPSPQGFPPGPYPYPPPPYGVPPGWYPPHGYQQMGLGQFPPPQMPLGPPGQRGPIVPQQGPGVPTPSGSAAPSEEPQPFAKPDDKPGTAAKVPGSSGTPIPLQEAPSSASPGGSVPEGKAEAVHGKAPQSGQKSNRIVPAVPLQKGAAPTNGPAVGKSVEDANREARAAVAAAMAKLPAAQGQKPQREESVEHLSKKVTEMRVSDHTRGNRGGQAGTGGYRARGNHHRGSGRPHASQQGTRIEIPTTDYDFDAANAKFNKQDLVKEAIASGSPITTPSEETIGDALANSANGTRKGSDGGISHTGPSYNKSTSFFDDISSEIKDRAEIQETGQRRGGREYRNEERQKNMETFGQGSVDNGYRYRGRGRGRSRGGPSYGRGRGVPRGGRGRGASAATDA